MPQGIQCIVGLGNPGSKYEATRHNAGYWFVEELARRHSARFRAEAKFFGETCRISAASEQCWLLKPTTFMNRSGQSVSALARFYRMQPDQILVAHDELDLIDHPGHKDQVVDYVLSPPRREEATQILDAIDRAADQLPLLLQGEYARVMNSLHSR